MNILLVLNRQLPALRYGGAERVVWSLAKELNRLGHKVTLLAARGTVCPFARVLVIDPSRAISEQIPEYVDVVHFNSTADPATRKPYIVTVHEEHLEQRESGVAERAIYLSRDHAMRNGSTQFIYNGLDWSEYGKVNLDRERKHYHFLGQADSHVKNLEGAMRIARSVGGGGSKLMVLGGNRFRLSGKFYVTLSPRIDFRGLVLNAKKADVMLRSKGLIYPVLWDEPFGLPIVESLFFGAPVFGTKRGSLPELIASDFGYVSNDEAEIVRAMKEADFSPFQCHQYAADCFNSRIMTMQYLKKYEAVINNKEL